MKRVGLLAAAKMAAKNVSAPAGGVNNVYQLSGDIVAA